jgi:hypothetical protein
MTKCKIKVMKCNLVNSGYSKSSFFQSLSVRSIRSRRLPLDSGAKIGTIEGRVATVMRLMKKSEKEENETLLSEI